MTKVNIQLIKTVFVLVFFTNTTFTIAQSESTPNHRMIEVEENVLIHIVDWGGKGPPVLFVPSWASTAHIFDNFAPLFTNEYRVFVMEKRGHGQSSRPDTGYEISRLIKDIESVLDRLEIVKINLIGLSRSESLITHFAAKYPDKTQSLVYLSGPIDRAYARNFYKNRDNLNAAYRSDALEQSIKSLCFINPKYERPEGSFDDPADEFGQEWRENDPSPPYSSIKAPALAFWHPNRTDADQFREHCQRWPENDLALQLIKRFESVSEPLFSLMDHDRNIFEHELGSSKIVDIPGALYHTFVSHPEIVEKEIRHFLQETNEH